jgi:hypothetical protein
MSVFRALFGPSREEIWRQFCAETGSNYVKGRLFKADKVQATHGEWTVTLDTFAVSTGKATIIFTRMRAPYVNPDAFRFNFYRKGIFTDLGKRFGMQDISVGYEPFDSDFVIQGNDEQKVRRLFSNQKIRELIAAQSDIRFCVKDDDGKLWDKFPEGVDELYFQVMGVIKDLERLKLLYDLFAETLDELCRTGSAYQQAPPVQL